MPDEEERTTPEENIFNRLSDALTFHPASVSLFTPDWTLEPGDVVKVLSGEEEYDVPIFTMDLAWNGAVKTDVQSTGNQERQPLSALKRIEYQTARRGYGATRKLEEDVEETVQQYQHFVQETDVYRQSVYKIMGVTYDEHGNVIYQRDPVTGELILDEAGNPIPVYDANSNGSITGQVLQTAQNYTSLYQMTLNAPEFDPTATYQIGDMVMRGGVVYKFTAVHTGDWTGLDVAVVPPLQSQITQNAQEISQKVSQGDLAGYMTITAMRTAFGNSAVAADGSITKAEFSTSVVDGIATAGITADKILIAGDTGIAGALTVAGYLFANDLFIENGAYVQDTIHVGGVHVYEDASFDGDITMTSTGTIQTGVIETEANIICGGDLSVTGDLTVTGTFSFDDISVDNVTATEYVTAAAFRIDDGGETRTVSELPVTIGGDTVEDLSILATGEAESLAIPDAITDIQIVAPSSGSNVYTINKKTFHNTSWTEVGTFSRATTLTGGWGSSNTDAGMFSVDADPQDQHYKIKFNGTSGTADAILDAVVGVGTPAASNTRIDFPIYIGTYTEGADMTTRVTLNRSVMISSELITSWTQDGIDRGYIAGQANANAHVNASDIIYNDYTAYISSTHTLQIGVFASPTLILKDQEGNETTSLKTGTEEIIEVETTVTAATLTSTYANGTYTVTKSSGGKVSVDGAEIDVGVTSYPISATLAIADAQNAMTAGGSWDTFRSDATVANKAKNVFRYQAYTTDDPPVAKGAQQTTQVNLNQNTWQNNTNTVELKAGTTKLAEIVVDASALVGAAQSTGYASGWGAAFGKVTLPASEQTTNAYMDVLTPPQTVDGNAVSQRYTVSVDGSYAYIKTGNPAVTVARVVNTGATVLYGEITGIVLRSAGGVNYEYSDDDKEYTVYLSATGTNVSNSPYDGEVVISGSEAYSHGWGQAHSQVSIPTAQQTANAYIDIRYPTSTVDGTAGSQRYTVSVDNDYAYIKAGNTTVARVENTGVAPAATKVHKGNWSVGSVQFTPSSDANDPTAYSLSLEISASLGTTASTTLSVKETSVTPNVSTGATKALYLKVKDDYVYILNENAEPNPATNVLSRTVNTGYENGQNSVTVTDASLVENLVVYDENSRTAIGPVDVTLSNGKQVRLEGIDFSNAYQAGLDGDSAVTSQTYEFELEDGDMFWNGVEHDIDVSAVYQQGVEDATPTTQYYAYIRRSVGSAAIGFYKPYKANPSLPSTTMWGQGLKKDTEVLLLSTEPVRSGSANYYYVMYQGFPGYISSSFFTDRPVYHTPAQGDHGGWYNNAKPTPAITGVTIQSIKHTEGYSGTVQILLQPDYGTSGKYNSTYVSSSDYNAIQVTTDENIETYLNTVYTTYYAVHSYNVYASNIPHKVTFNVTTEIGTKKVVLEFNSCAKVPSIQTITLQGMIHNRMDYIDDITVRVDPVYASARNTTSTAVQAAEYANTPVTDSNTDVYMEYVYSTYYGTHSSRTYNTSLGHKATFLVTYDIGDSQNVTVQFVSYAKQPAVTSTTLDWIRHYAGTYSGGIEVKCAQRGKSASERTSEASEQYNNLTVTDEPGTYLSLIDGSNYGRHSNYYYNRRLEHKACFTVRYDDGYSEEHIVRFESTAVSPSVSYVEITRVCHVNQFYNGSFTITEMKDNAWFTTYATSVSDINGDYVSTAVSGSVFDNLSVNGNASDYFDSIAGSGLTAIYGEHFIKSKPTGTTENKMQMTVYYSDGHSGNVTIRFYTRPVAETWEETGMTVNSIVHPRGAYTDDIVITYATIFSGVTATKNSEFTNSMPSKTSTHSYFTYATHDRGLYNTDLTHAARITVTSKSNYGNTKTENIVDRLGSRAV